MPTHQCLFVIAWSNNYDGSELLLVDGGSSGVQHGAVVVSIMSPAIR